MSSHQIRWDTWQLLEIADRRFRLICLQIAVPIVAFVIAMAIIDIQRDATVVIPPPVRQYAKLLPPPPLPEIVRPPPPPKPKPIPEPEPEPIKEAPEVATKPTPKSTPKPQVRPVPRPVPVPVPVPEPRFEPTPLPPTPKPEPKPEPTAEQKTAAARQRAANSGLVSLSQDLAALRDSRTADRVATGAAVITGTGAPPKQAAASSSLGGASRSSGGIDTGSLSRDIGETRLGERSTQTVQAAAGTAAAKPQSARSGSRDREAVEEVFDQNKGAIYALYNRALRDNPALQGKLVLQLTIEPDGTVSSCSVVSSELNDPVLEARLVERVKLFRFKAADVPTVTTTKPITFFPANN